MKDAKNAAPAACTLSDGDQAGRRERWIRLADSALLSKAATGAGVELRYRAEPAVHQELTELARLEADCCGFASWDVTEAGEILRLSVETAREQAPALWAMFDASPAATESR